MQLRGGEEERAQGKWQGRGRGPGNSYRWVRWNSCIEAGVLKPRAPETLEIPMPLTLAWSPVHRDGSVFRSTFSAC